MLNLDTHILLFALNGELKGKERQLLRTRWSISAIVLWEIAKLSELSRINVTLKDKALRAVLDRIQIWPITSDICRALTRLDFESDPADELIAATSLVHGVPLLTRDRKLRRSKIVPLAKR